MKRKDPWRWVTLAAVGLLAWLSPIVRHGWRGTLAALLVVVYGLVLLGYGFLRLWGHRE
jgi:hypothetical protein